MLLIAFLAIAAQVPPGRPYKNRVEFFRLAYSIIQGWNQGQVRNLLGPPDDVLAADDSADINPDRCLVWCYGSIGHGTFPTLGKVVFDLPGGLSQQVFWQKTDPPSMSVISDAEMDTHLRRLGQDLPSDLLWVIRAANVLRPLGKEKALAVMVEYSRVSDQWGSDRLFWLGRALFAWLRPNASSNVPYNGPTTPSLSDSAKWMDFPVMESDGIPFSFHTGRLPGDVPWPFENYASKCQVDWVLRRWELRPSNDPFHVLKRIAHDRRWKLISFGGMEALTERRIEMDFMPELLALVRDAWKPKEVGENVDWREPPITFEKLHAEFLAAKVHWDGKKQNYVCRR